MRATFRSKSPAAEHACAQCTSIRGAVQGKVLTKHTCIAFDSLQENSGIAVDRKMMLHRVEVHKVLTQIVLGAEPCMEWRAKGARGAAAELLSRPAAAS